MTEITSVGREEVRISKLPHISLSSLMEQGAVSSIGILIASGGIEDRTEDEKTLIKLMTLIRAEYPEAKINVAPYNPHEEDKTAKYTKVAKVRDANQLTLSIAFSGKEVLVYSFQHNRKMNGSFLSLKITKNVAQHFH